MAATSVPMFFWLLVCLALAGGAWLLWTGVRGRRIGDDPFCRRCRCSVAGISNGVCPECGMDLTQPDGVLVGQLVRSPRRAVQGVILFLLTWAVLSASQSELLENRDSKAAAPIPPLLWLAVCLALPGGLWFACSGWRGRRVGDAPTCARCRYSVAGISSNNCPECGADLTTPNAVLFGERIRRPKAVVLGVTTILLASIVLTAARSERLRNYDWYVHAPMRWVLADLAGPPSEQRLRAWKELNRRSQLYGPLSQEDHDRLAMIALIEQLVPSPTSAAGGYTVTQGLLDWLENEAVNGNLRPEQSARFFENALSASLTVRPVARLGDPVPFHISLDPSSDTGRYGRWISRVDELKVSVDGGEEKTLDRRPTGAGLGRGTMISSTVMLTTPGEHELAFTLHVTVITLPQATGAGSNVRQVPLHDYELTLKGKVKVLPPGARP